MHRDHATGANRRVPVLLMLAFIAALSALGAPGVSAQGRSGRLAGAGPVTLEGELEVSYEDDEARGTARLVHVLKALGARVPLKFPGKSTRPWASLGPGRSTRSAYHPTGAPGMVRAD